ncbi:MAG: hypothetical protein HY761_03185 [Candidatus Omnitrophica bacterium]|nr:hypothetical protein [Candidatus Omnitrophota bacterium]
MANPMSDEQRIYEKIEKEKLIIPSVIWELLDHHLGNDVYTISLIAGSHVTGQEKEPIPIEDGEKIVKHCVEIKKFLQKLNEATRVKS